MDDERLIVLVRELGELYDCNHKKYCDPSHKMKLWIVIGKKLRQDAQKCKQRWESLRSQFRKFLRCKKAPADQASNSYPPKWRYERQLQFLIPHMKDKLRVTSMLSDNEGCSQQVKEEDEESNPLTEEDDDPPILEKPTALTKARAQYSSPKSTAKRRKVLPAESPSGTMARHGKEKKKKTPDELHLFFETMKATVNKFSEPDKFLAKQRVFQVISEIETKQIHEQCSSYANHLVPLPLQHQSIYTEDQTSTTSAANMSHYSPSSMSPVSSVHSFEPQQSAPSSNASHVADIVSSYEEDTYEDP